MNINKNNFFVASKGDFTCCETPDREPDYVSYFKDNPSSYYWYEEDYLVRRSNHWGLVANCNWTLLNVNTVPAEFGSSVSPVLNGEIVEMTGKALFSCMTWMKAEELPRTPEEVFEFFVLKLGLTNVSKDLMEVYK